MKRQILGIFEKFWKFFDKSQKKLANYAIFTWKTSKGSEISVFCRDVVANRRARATSSRLETFISLLFNVTYKDIANIINVYKKSKKARWKKLRKRGQKWLLFLQNIKKSCNNVKKSCNKLKCCSENPKILLFMFIFENPVLEGFFAFDILKVPEFWRFLDSCFRRYKKA